MLKLSGDEYIEATDRLAKALERAEEAGMRTHMGRAGVMLEALGNDFDVSAMDPGPREDITSGNVFGCARCLSESHSTAEHDEQFAARLRNEIASYNRDVLGAE
jgi:hypothetical protein